MKNKKTLAAILCGIGIALVTLVLLIPFIYTFLVSIKNYSAYKGLFGGEFVGLDQFFLFFESPYFPRLFRNSFVISLLGTILGAFYVYVSSVAISSGRNPFLKGFLTALFILPALVPVSLYMSLLPRIFYIEPSFLLTLFVSFIEGLKIAGLVVFVAFFIKGNAFLESLKCLLLFLAIRLIFCFTNNLEWLLTIYQPRTYESLDVFSTYVFRTFMANGDYSIAAVAQITKIALQFIPAALACVILIFINKPKKEGTSLSNVRFLPTAVAAIAPIALFIWVLIAAGSLLPRGIDVEIIATGYLFEFLYAFLSALLVTIVSYLLALTTRYSKIVGCIALTFLALTSNTLIGPYLMIRDFSLLNTVLAPVLMNMNMVPVLALLLSFILYREHSIKSNITAVIMGFSMMFATFWGSYLAPYITLHNRGILPFSDTLRRIFINLDVSLLEISHFSGAHDFDITPIPLSTVPHILIPAIVIGFGLLLSAIIYIIKKKKTV